MPDTLTIEPFETTSMSPRVDRRCRSASPLAVSNVPSPVNVAAEAHAQSRSVTLTRLDGPPEGVVFANVTRPPSAQPIRSVPMPSQATTSGAA